MPIAHANGLELVSFLNGCWAAKNGEEFVTEKWRIEGADQMVGLSQTMRGGQLVQEETIQILWNESSRSLSYTPTLNGRQLNTFTLDPLRTRLRNQAVFTDFSNKTLKLITYTKSSETTLNVRLEGNQASGEAFDFNYDMFQEACIY